MGAIRKGQTSRAFTPCVYVDGITTTIITRWVSFVTELMPPGRLGCWSVRPLVTTLVHGANWCSCPFVAAARSSRTSPPMISLGSLPDPLYKDCSRCAAFEFQLPSPSATTVVEAKWTKWTQTSKASTVEVGHLHRCLVSWCTPIALLVCRVCRATEPHHAIMASRTQRHHLASRRQRMVHAAAPAAKASLPQA
jgi:hypothetical protein